MVALEKYTSVSTFLNMKCTIIFRPKTNQFNNKVKRNFSETYPLAYAASTAFWTILHTLTGLSFCSPWYLHRH